MKNRTKGTQHSPTEKPPEATPERRGGDTAKPARNKKKPTRAEVTLDPVVNEIMIRRIMAALMSPE